MSSGNFSLSSSHEEKNIGENNYLAEHIKILKK